MITKVKGPKPQIESKENLKKQRRELDEYLKHSAYRDNSQTKNNDEVQKLEQIDNALKQKGEVDSAFRLHKNYRKGSQNPQ